VTIWSHVKKKAGVGAGRVGTLLGVDLGPVGIWWSGSWRTGDDGAFGAAGGMEDVGYTALWSSGGFDPGLSTHFEKMLGATDHVTVASGIVSVWAASPDDVSRSVADIDGRYPGRFLLGIGASHSVIVQDYSRPYSHVVEYLDALDTAGVVTKEHRVLAALGPRMLELAGERAAGAHPYFVPVEHTARARATLGPGPMLAPEVTVVLETDEAKARGLARTFTEGYLGLPNYRDNLRTLGFDEEDVAGGGSDRLVDAVVAWGDVGAIARRVRDHHDAGADHVCVQVVSTGRESCPVAEYRELAAGLLD
jgi:probable F420-dependent oxidoreductase